MDSALKLQLDVRNNAEDLRTYAADLRNWEEEMKRKESQLDNEKYQGSSIPPPRNKIKRSKQGSEKNSNKPKKISAYDYSAWDKFDVEKACAEIDDEDFNEKPEEEQLEEKAVESNNEEEEDENDNDVKRNRNSLIDEAFYEKEMGNKFVKNEQWADAIKCYTNAINLDGNNAIYYANRSLCFLKLKNFKAAETDATTAIQLDKNYVKAYQRRAFARQALGQIQEAKSDYEQVLRLEPKNALARVEINKINEKLQKELEKNKAIRNKVFDHKNMFKNEDKLEIKSVNSVKKQATSSKPIDSSKKQTPNFPDSSKPTPPNDTTKPKIESTKREENSTNMGSKTMVRNFERGDGDKVAQPTRQPTTGKGGVFKPLPEWCKAISPVNLPPHKRSKKPLKRINISFVTTDEDSNCTPKEKTECLDKSEKKDEKINTNKSVERELVKNLNKAVEDERLGSEKRSFDIPKTAIQFQNCWKILKKNPEASYSYLKKIPASDLPQIFENSLEADFFSELLTFLASDEVKKDPDIVYNFLLGFSKVKRFSSLILFMSEADRRCVKTAVSQLMSHKSKEETAELLRLYELHV